MTNQEEQLLLKDLSARVPYGVCVRVTESNPLPNYEHITLGFVGGYINNLSQDYTIEDIVEVLDSNGTVQLYLRPMSSMTEAEFLEYYNIKYNKVTYRDNWKRIDVGKFKNIGIIPIEEYLEWLNAHHFDYRGLIEKGLALEAPKNMYKIN